MASVSVAGGLFLCAQNGDTINDAKRSIAAGQASGEALARQQQRMLDQDNVPLDVPTFGPKASLNPDLLLRPQDLPGYGQKVDPAMVRTLAASTVEIESRPHGNTHKPWQPACNGIKLNFEGLSFVLTSASCDSSIQQTKIFPNGKANMIKDVLGDSSYDFAISRPLGAGSSALVQTPLTLVTGESQMLGNSMSLLRVADTPAFEAIPGVSETALANPTPLLGQSVTAVGYTKANRYRETTAEGIFLGRYLTWDMVAFKANPDSQSAVCSANGLGSSAMLSSGLALGPLEAADWVDQAYTQKHHLTPAQKRLVSQQQVAEEEVLGVDISNYGVLCSYDVGRYQGYAALAGAWAGGDKGSN